MTEEQTKKPRRTLSALDKLAALRETAERAVKRAEERAAKTHAANVEAHEALKQARADLAQIAGPQSVPAPQPVDHD